MLFWVFALSAIVTAVALVDKYKWAAEDVKPSITNSLFNAYLKPHFNGDRCTGFDITLENQTGDELEVLWDKCLYVQDNQTNDGVYFGGKNLSRELNKPREKDVVFSEATNKFTVYPTALAEERWDRHITDLDRDSYRRPLKSHFMTHSMLEGEHGIYLVVVHKKQEYKEKMCFKLTKVLKED